MKSSINVSENINNRILNNFEIVSLFNLFVLFFVGFFGTSLPFQKLDSTARFAEETTNIVNQIVYSFLFISSLLLIIKNAENTTKFIRKERYLSIFILFCLLSAIWSSYSFLSIKRSFQLITSFMVLINTILIPPYRNTLRVIKIVFFTYVSINIFSGIFIPQAIDPEFGTWRGITIQKNSLAQTSLLIFVVSLIFIHEDKSTLSKTITYTILILSLTLILLAFSSTNILGLLLVLILLLLFYFENLFKPIGVGRYITLIFILFVLIASFFLIIFSKETLEFITGIFGKDLTFSGRVEIWEYLWNDFLKRFWLGYGYSTYWVLGTYNQERFEYFVGFIVNEAHNGYLEIMLQLGIIGFILLITFIISFLVRAIKTSNNIALVSLAAILVLNFSEATIFTLRSSTTLVLMFFYLIVTFNYYQRKEQLFS